MALARFTGWVAGHRFVSLLAVAVAVLGKNVVELCHDKAYAIDEFLYTHRAWMVLQPDDGLIAAIGRGEAFVPSALMAPFAALGGDDPATMLYVRLSMLLAVVVCAAGVAVLAGGGPAIERKHRLGVALVASLFLLSDPTAMKHLVEIRPDGVAAALLVAALVLLRWRRLGDGAAAGVAGLLVFAAIMSSLKAVVVGAGLAPIFVRDLFATRSGRSQTLRSAPLFAVGFAAGGLAVFAVVLSTSSPGAFWHGYYGVMAFHEEHYAAIELERFLWPYLQEVWPVLLLAAIGSVTTSIEVARNWRARRVLGLDVLLMLFWAGAWASFLLQRAAYPYSLIPAGVFSAILGARGVAWIATPLVERRAAPAVGAIALAGFVALALGRVTPKYGNDKQIEVQRQIGVLTEPNDAAYDLSGTYVYRPRGHRFVFVDRSRLRALKAELEREVPRSLVERQVVLFVWDKRFAASWRKTQLGEFIFEHYQPRSWELFFWGREYAPKSGQPMSAKFRAIKSGRYFVYPTAAARRVRIDGVAMPGPIVELTRGLHRVEIAATIGDESVYLIWLPADGVPFDPTRYRWYGAGRKNALGRWILP